MAEHEDQTPETEDVEVVAHSADEEEAPGCIINNSNQLEQM